MLVQSIEEIALFQDVPRIFMPMIWFEQKFAITADMASQIKIAVKMPCIGRFVGMVMIGCGIFFTVVSFLVAWLQSKTLSQMQQREINLGDNKVGARLKKEVSPLLNDGMQVKPTIVSQRKESNS